jgi:DNA-directed RNA polymerase subunit RPC12/RpoP
VRLRRWAPTARPLRGVIDVYKCLHCGDTMAVNADAQTFREPPPMECKACPGEPDMQSGRYYAVGTASTAA